MKTFTVKENCNLRDFTDSVYPQGAFCLGVLLKNKDVKVNGARVNKNVLLHCGDEVVYYTTPKQEDKPSHLAVYGDEEVFIADKFSGVSSEGLLRELCGRGEFYAVHRLDRNTQGLIVFAKTKAAAEELLAAFKERRVHKTYIALCADNFKRDGAVLTAYLKKDEKNSVVKIYDGEVNGAAKIVTEYKVLERRVDIALVEINLHTGKTHQIRAHMAHIGCPVLGDGKYGDNALNKKYKLARQCLIAKRLTFELTGALAYLNKKEFESSFTL